MERIQLGAHSINSFYITIEFHRLFHFSLMQILRKWSLQNVAYDMTTVLLWQVQKFSLLVGNQSKNSDTNLSLNFNSGKENLWNGPEPIKREIDEEIMTCIAAQEVKS